MCFILKWKVLTWKLSLRRFRKIVISGHLMPRLGYWCTSFQSEKINFAFLQRKFSLSQGNDVKPLWLKVYRIYNIHWMNDQSQQSLEIITFWAESLIRVVQRYKNTLPPCNIWCMLAIYFGQIHYPLTARLLILFGKHYSASHSSSTSSITSTGW